MLREVPNNIRINMFYEKERVLRRWQSGQLHWTVNPTTYGLRGFKSLPAH